MKSGKSTDTIQGFPLFLCTVLLLTSHLSLPASQHAGHRIPVVPQELLERPVPMRTGIGRAHDAVATKSAEAQGFYDQGLAYLHSYVWIEAARSFHHALRLDPGLALAHVGLSYAYIEVNKPVEARQAIESASALSATADKRGWASQMAAHERHHVDARRLQMAAEEAPGDKTRLAAYRKALDTAIAAFPDDVELILKRGMAESPDPADRGQGSVMAAVPFYERALKLSPNHMGARHYLAHAYENSGRVNEALTQAAAFAAQAPQVPHAVHMHGHELRRAGRPVEAVAQFEAADKLQRAYFAREKVGAELDWHHTHNLDLLATTYQYLGQMKKAEPLLKQSFDLPSSLLVQLIHKREWLAFLVARNRQAEALDAAKVLISHPNPLVQAAGHIEAGLALLSVNKAAEAGAASNAALRALKSSPGGQDLVFIGLEALQGEFRLRTAQREQGRKMMLSAAQKWRSLPGPDAWSQSLFRLEAMARAARSVGDWELAGRMAQLMSEHDPAYFGTHYALALVAQNAGNAATARREFDLALKAWAAADKDLPELKAADRK
ncbi:MAG: tetratricopeptide repeat protein [Acidobacteriota bacterium]|nr:tetratricopeptide repeat protein [Acidobacteriota bacterium]